MIAFTHDASSFDCPVAVVAEAGRTLNPNTLSLRREYL
jgi:hypothetical protein